jgi:LysR family nitrogen assimilation transcriptional regulator
MSAAVSTSARWCTARQRRSASVPEAVTRIAASPQSATRNVGVWTGTVALTDLQQVPLLLPVPIHTIRQTVDKAFGQASLTPVVAAELDSVVIMMQAVREGLGAAILPGSARRFFYLGDLKVRRIVDPELELTVSICVSEHQPLSEPAWPGTASCWS